MMSQNVERLKALLFDDEAVARKSLERKVETLAEQDARGREELRQKVEHVFDRTGTPERLTVSVSEILDEALRKAEIDRHDDLSKSIAPLVVSTIKRELRNSQDEMVEALYPITGRLVKSYVASAMKDLTDQMNRRLEQNPVMLRLQSIATGRPVAELALAGTQDFNVEELYLIRRGTGELVAHWPEGPASSDDQNLSGVLAAINEFANEAFSADQGSMRQIDLGEETIFLRGSPLYLLAARCRGKAPPFIEEILDDSFLNCVETQNAVENSSLTPADKHSKTVETIAAVGTELKNKVTAATAHNQNPIARTNPLKILTAAVLVPLMAWMAWSWYGQMREDRVRSTAQRIIATVDEMKGYPAELDVLSRGRILVVSGLAPSAEVRSLVHKLIVSELSGTELRDQLTVVAGAGEKLPDLSPELRNLRKDLDDQKKATMAREAAVDLQQAIVHLARAAQDLDQSAKLMKDAKLAGAVKIAAADIDTVLKTTVSTPGADDQQIRAKVASLADRIDTVSATLQIPGTASAKQETKTATGNISSYARLRVSAERLASLASAVSIVSRLEPPPTPAPVVQAPEVTPLQRLQVFAVSKAIFFANDADYRNIEQANRLIQDLASLVKASGNLIRLVGYTDDGGNQARNAPLALQRAERVRSDLLSLGVAPNMVVAVGRADGREVSPDRGPDSPNRRVEIEVGFEGESRP